MALVLGMTYHDLHMAVGWGFTCMMLLSVEGEHFSSRKRCRAPIVLVDRDTLVWRVGFGVSFMEKLVHRALV